MRVRSMDQAGNVDATPVRHTWVVTALTTEGEDGRAAEERFRADVDTGLGGRDAPLSTASGPDLQPLPLESSGGTTSGGGSGVLADLREWFDDAADLAEDYILATVGITIGAVSIVVIVCAWVCLVCRKSRSVRLSERLVDLEHQLTTVRRGQLVNGGEGLADGDLDTCHIASVLDASLPANCRRFSYKELSDATSEFRDANVLGEGGFGKVYHGVLKDGTQVAVKKLDKG